MTEAIDFNSKPTNLNHTLSAILLLTLLSIFVLIIIYYFTLNQNSKKMSALSGANKFVMEQYPKCRYNPFASHAECLASVSSTAAAQGPEFGAQVDSALVEMNFREQVKAGLSGQAALDFTAKSYAECIAEMGTKEAAKYVECVKSKAAAQGLNFANMVDTALLIVFKEK